MPHAGASVAAGCGFWREAVHSVFWTAGAEHPGCPIGTLTMGFEPSPDQQADAGRLVGEMEALGYLAPGEVGALPMVPGPTR